MKKTQQQSSSISRSGAGGQSGLVKQAQERKSLIQSGKIPDSEAEAVTLNAWKDLCLAQGLSLKEFSSCRALMDACVAKWPHVTSVLTERIVLDLTTVQGEKTDVRIFSRRLLAALDCESTRKCVREVMSLQGSEPASLLVEITQSLSQLEHSLCANTTEITKDFLESQRDAERCFDCVGRVLSFIGTRSLSVDTVLERLQTSTENLILSGRNHNDVHLLRSASLALHHINATLTAPLSLQSMLYEGKLAVGAQTQSSINLPSMTRSALLLGALSCVSNNTEIDSEQMLNDLLDTIESCLTSEESEDGTVDRTSDIQNVEERFEKITLACEALCAWCTKAKTCQSCTSSMIVRAMQLVILFMDHRESSVATVCAAAFERLIETSLRVDQGAEVLATIFLEQMNQATSPDFASARRGLYPMMEKLVTVLGAKRVSELEPNFVSMVMNSAFRVDENMSNRQELGNGICNLVVCFFRCWMAELGFKLSKEFKVELEIIANILKRGPDDLFASYYVCRRLLSDLLSEAKSAQEQECIREAGKAFLFSIQDPCIRETLNQSKTDLALGKSSVTMKRSFERSIEEVKTGSTRQATELALLWARLNILLALERGNTHVTILADRNSDGIGLKKGTKRKTYSGLDFVLEAHVLQKSLVHERPEIRDVAWALASTRVRRAKFPEPILLRLVPDAFGHVLKYEGTALKPSIIRLLDRIKFCLDADVTGEDGDETAKIESQRFVTYCSEHVGSCIYPGAPFDRIALGLDIAVYIVQTFAAKYMDLISPLLLPGTIRSMLSILESPFDVARAQAYEFLRFVPGPLPGLETRSKLMQLLSEYWFPRLSARMRRDADSAALFFRLIHSKYCQELGWAIELPISTCSRWSLESKAAVQIQVNQAQDAYYMRCALEEARKCASVPTAYDVGCVIVDSKTRAVISSGFSREIPGNTHAEECALRKLGVERQPEMNFSSLDDCALGNAVGSVLYTTMEPCSLRLSGNRPCSARCIAAKVSKVVVGVKEPDKFVKNCEGWNLLEQNGIVVQSLQDEDVLAECAIIANKNDHTIPKGFEANKERSFTRFMHQADLPRVEVSELLCHQMLDLLENVTVKAAEGADDVPIHGCLMTLRYVLADLELGRRRDLLERLLNVLMGTLETGVNTLKRLEDSSMDRAVAVATEDDDFITKTMSWLAVREGSELLSEAVEKLILCFPEEVNSDAANAQRYCTWFLNTSLALRHLGAMTYVTKGLERVCRLLLQSNTINLQRIPNQVFLQELFTKLGKEEFDRALRRTEGFSLTFRGILRSAYLSNRIDIINSIMRDLLNVCSNAPSPKHAIAALNVLCMLFEDAVLAKAVMPFVSSALELAVKGFRHELWGIRNSSLNVFVSLIKRAVGEPDQAMGGDEEAKERASGTTRTKSHSTTASLFFKTHPRLFPFLLKELIEATSSQGEHPSLHPVLLFLSSLRRSTLVKDDPALEFAPYVEKVVLHHPAYFMRSTASKALVQLTPREHAPFKRLVMILSGQDPLSVSTNACHGSLLLIQQWAKSTGGYSGLVADHEEELAELQTVLGNHWIKSPTKCYLLREIALDCFSRLYNAKDALDLVKVAWAQDAEPGEVEGGDEAKVGKSRFKVRLMRLMMQLAVRAQDWNLVADFLLRESSSPHLHLALEEFAYWMEESKPNINSTESIHEILRLLIVPLRSQKKAKRNELQFHLGAVFAVVQRTNGIVKLSKDEFFVLNEIARADNSSFQSQAMALKLMSSSQVMENLDQDCFPLFLEALEQFSVAEAPLELRLAAAHSLRNGGLERSTPDELALRCWIRALFLLQDDDREVCDIARQAVLNASAFEGKKYLSSCLDVSFRLAWSTITERFWNVPLWQERLQEWIFGDSQQLIDRELEHNDAKVSASAVHDTEDDEETVLFKTDNPNQFFETSYFTMLAGEEMASIRRLRLLQPTASEADFQTFRNLAQRSAKLLQDSLSAFPVVAGSDAFVTLFHAVVAARAFGDPLDRQLCTSLAKAKEVLHSSMPLKLLRILEQAESRI